MKRKGWDTVAYLIGIDVGTSGTKTALFDEVAHCVASRTVEYPMYQPQNGWAEQDPADWWNAVAEGIRAVLEKSGVRAGDIAGVGLSGQMHGLVMLDDQGNPLRRAILWCDQRTGRECAELEATMGRDRLIAVTANPAMTGFTAAKILWVKRHEPECFARCAHILLPKDYIRYCLTGVFATEVSDASGMQMMDIPGRRWSPEMLELLGVREEQLGRMFESPEVTGRVNREAAALTGLCEGTPVVGGAGDNAAAAVGTGVVAPGRAFTTIGTSAVVYTVSDGVHIDPQGRVHTFCASVPGKWTVMSCTQSAGLSLQWLRNTCCTAEQAQAEQEGRDVYALMDEMAAGVPIGAGRLLYLPYLMGERSPHPDPDCRGVFFGLSAVHSRANLIRAVLEGVAYSQRECVDVFREMGVSVEDMAVCGGGGRSRIWRQILADLYGCPVSTLRVDEGAALGAALLAGVGAGVYTDVVDACAKTVHKGETYPSNREAHEAYEPYYQLYKQLYRDLREDFACLAQLG